MTLLGQLTKDEYKENRGLPDIRGTLVIETDRTRGKTIRSYPIQVAITVCSDVGVIEIVNFK